MRCWLRQRSPLFQWVRQWWLRLQISVLRSSSMGLMPYFAYTCSPLTWDILADALMAVFVEGLVFHRPFTDECPKKLFSIPFHDSEICSQRRHWSVHCFIGLQNAKIDCKQWCHSVTYQTFKEVPSILLVSVLSLALIGVLVTAIPFL